MNPPPRREGGGDGAPTSGKGRARKNRYDLSTVEESRRTMQSDRGHTNTKLMAKSNGNNVVGTQAEGYGKDVLQTGGWDTNRYGWKTDAVWNATRWR